MGSSPSSLAPASPGFLAAFRAHADGSGAMPFARFMALALYDPAAGYYRSERTRIGYGEGTDFFTATTSGPLFGELVAAACVKLLGPRDPRTFTFVELGVDSGEGIMAGVSHPFGATRAIRLGEPIALAGACVVFSNELFDAQPFQRFVFRDGAWRELGVRLRGDALLETELPAAADDIARLPRAAAAGYVIDAPFAAAALAVEITRQPWSGLFVACDYGKSWRELTEATPAGTARAYFRHAQSNQLLAQPGAQDLTCHVCWDWLANALADGGFAPPTLESQEAFLVHHAAELIARISADEAVHLSRRKLALMQLLHPAHLGQKFQVLHASRV